MIRAVIPILFAALLFSCATDGIEGPEIKDINDMFTERINGYIRKDRPFTALQELFTMEREAGGLETEDLDIIRSSALTKINELFFLAVEDENFRDAHRIYKSLSMSGMLTDEFASWDGKSLLEKRIGKKLENQEIVSAVSLYHQMLDSYDSSEDELIEYGNFAVGINNRPFLQRVVALLENKGLHVPDNFYETAVLDEDTAMMLKGNVTIWVNRGMRIEKGIGYADRVIGSGFFIDKRGYLITNHHVIKSEVDPEYEGFSRLYVKLPGSGNMKIPAAVIGWDEIFDIALLKVEIDPEFIFSFNGTDKIEPGERIFAIGSPGGLESTITSGIVSAIGRRFLQMGDVMQVDVPINHGNSGGPLLNSRGEVIGIVFAGIEEFEGINFAIPSSWVINLIPKLFDGGAITHPWLGAAVYENNDGLEVIYTVPGESADRAGIMPGDIIKSVNGITAGTIGNMQQELLSMDPESLIDIKWMRDGKETGGLISLSGRPGSPIIYSMDRDTELNLITPLFGMSYKETGSVLWEKNYTVNKVYGGFIADETGISEDDPFSILKFVIDEDQRTALFQLRVKKKKAGFLESAIQLGAYIDVDYFI